MMGIMQTAVIPCLRMTDRKARTLDGMPDVLNDITTHKAIVQVN
jgi:hypothetical protein